MDLVLGLIHTTVASLLWKELINALIFATNTNELELCFYKLFFVGLQRKRRKECEQGMAKGKPVAEEDKKPPRTTHKLLQVCILALFLLTFVVRGMLSLLWL